MSETFTTINTHDHTQIIVNLGLIHRDNEVQWYWQQWIEHMRSIGWRCFAMYVWDKCEAIAGSFHGRLAPCFELLFHFNKQARLPHKIIAKQPTSIRVNTRNTSLRNPDGTMRGISNPRASLQTHKIPSAIIKAGSTKHNRANQYGIHPATFPIMLPRQIIETYTDQHQIVLDPFAGSGTTIIAAHQCDRVGYGIELEPSYCDLAINRIQNETGLLAYRQDNESFDHLTDPYFYESTRET